MYLGIEGRYEELPHHTIWLGEDYEEQLRDIDERHRLPSAPSVYVHNPSLVDPTLPPDPASADRVVPRFEDVLTVR